MRDPQPEPAALWSNDAYTIRPARDNEEFRATWWGFMQELGWNRGYRDLDSYLHPSLPNGGRGMLLLLDHATGHPVGQIAAIVNANATGWVAMFIIAKAHRGRGLGRPLFRAAMGEFERCGVRVVGLDGVVEQRGTYERRGFVASPLGEVKIMTRALVASEPVGDAPGCNGQRMDVRQVPRAMLAELELTLTGFERPGLWSDEHMFDRADVGGVALVSTSDLKTPIFLRAWALTRRCSGGIRIGPVYAREAISARVVLMAAMEAATPSSIMSTPLPNEAMNDWSEEKIASEATLVAEVWGGNPKSVQLFEALGWKSAGVEYVRMWVDGKATPEQSEGGKAQGGVYAIFDAAVG